MTKQTLPGSVAQAQGSAPEFYQEVAGNIADQGYLSVTWQDVAAVHARLQRGETMTGVVDQVIAWSIWHQNQTNAPD